MYKFLNLFLFFACIAYVSAAGWNREDVSKTLDSHLRKNQIKRYGYEPSPINIRDNINYERKHNYELYKDKDKKLQQYKTNVNEPRQILKQNIPDFRYAINDMEILFNVYPYEPRYEKKILRETLKPSSLCYALTGLLLPKLNEIQINNSPLYGFVIKGARNGDSIANNTLEIRAVLSNIEYPLGTFEFPPTDELHYQIPFLVNYYENASGYNRKYFSYICPLPRFLIDVFHTSSRGLQFNFNGRDIEADELFPITVTYFNGNSKATPIQRTQPTSAEIKKATELINNIGADVKYRNVTNSGPSGNGLQSPLERIFVNESFIKMKEEVRSFLNNSSFTFTSQENIPLYFLILSQNLFKSKPVKTSSIISNVELLNVKANKYNGLLESYELRVTLNGEDVVSVKGVAIKNAKIPVPSGVTSGEKLSVSVSPAYGFELTPQGIKYVFCGFEDQFSKLFDYKMNKLASLVVLSN